MCTSHPPDVDVTSDDDVSSCTSSVFYTPLAEPPTRPLYELADLAASSQESMETYGSAQDVAGTIAPDPQYGSVNKRKAVTRPRHSKHRGRKKQLTSGHASLDETNVTSSASGKIVAQEPGSKDTVPVSRDAKMLSKDMQHVSKETPVLSNIKIHVTKPTPRDPVDTHGVKRKRQTFTADAGSGARASRVPSGKGRKGSFRKHLLSRHGKNMVCTTPAQILASHRHHKKMVRATPAKPEMTSQKSDEERPTKIPKITLTDLDASQILEKTIATSPPQTRPTKSPETTHPTIRKAVKMRTKQTKRRSQDEVLEFVRKYGSQRLGRDSLSSDPSDRASVTSLAGDVIDSDDTDNVFYPASHQGWNFAKTPKTALRNMFAGNTNRRWSGRSNRVFYTPGHLGNFSRYYHDNTNSLVDTLESLGIEMDTLLKGEGHHHKVKVIQTFCLTLAYLAVGMCYAILGPTILDIELALDIPTWESSQLFSTRGVGSLFGSILVMVIFDKVNHNAMFWCWLMIAAVSTVLFPVFPVYWVAMVIMGLQGVALGLLDAASSVLCVTIWGVDNAPYMQLIHFFYGVGSILAPLVATPFVYWPDEVNGTAYNISYPIKNLDTESQPTNAVSTINVTDILNSNLNIPPQYINNTDHINPDTMVTDYLNNSTADDLPQMYQYTYYIMGLVFGLSFMCYVFLWLCIDRAKCKIDPKDRIRTKEERTEKQSKLTEKLIIFLLCVFQFNHLGIEISYKGLITVFAVKSLRWGIAEATLVGSSCYAMYTVGRGIGIFVSPLLPPVPLLVCNLLIMLAILLVELFCAHMSHVVLWVTAGGLGLGMSTVLPSTLTWTEQLIDMSGKTAGLLMVAASLGMLAIPGLMGWLMDTVGHEMTNMFDIVHLVFLTLNLITFVLIFILSKRITPIEEDYFINTPQPKVTSTIKIERVGNTVETSINATPSGKHNIPKSVDSSRGKRINIVSANGKIAGLVEVGDNRVELVVPSVRVSRNRLLSIPGVRRGSRLSDISVTRHLNVRQRRGLLSQSTYAMTGTTPYALRTFIER